MKYSLKNIETYLTNQKRLLYLSVAAGAVFLFSIGVILEGKITDSAEQKARMYQTAIQVQDDKQLNYSIDTKQGRLLAEITVKPVDLVKFPEMNKEYSKVKKIEERYTRKTREVCETHYRTETRTRTVTDSDGETSTESYTVEVPYEVCHEETYYEWDFKQDWEMSAKEVDMAGRKYPIDLFALASNDIDAKDIIPGATEKYTYVRSTGVFGFDIDLFGEADEGDLRYSYEVLQLPRSGTVFLDVREAVRPVFGNKIGMRPQKPQELVKSAQKEASTQSTIFKVFWTILILSEIIGLGYLVWKSKQF